MDEEQRKRIEKAWFKGGLDIEVIAANEGLPVYGVAAHIMDLQDMLATYRSDSMHWQERPWWDSNLTPLVVAIGTHKISKEKADV